MKKINLPQQGSGRPKVAIAANLIRDHVILDRDGNELSSHNPRTRRIIKKVEQEQ